MDNDKQMAMNIFLNLNEDHNSHPSIDEDALLNLLNEEEA